MYDNQTILSCLTGLIGFERPYDAASPAVDADLAASSSGTFVGPSLHPLLTYENVWACAEQFSKITPPAWSDAVTYPKDAVVVSSSIIYQSKVASNLNHAVGDTDFWRVTTLYSVFLRRMYNGAITKLFSRLATEKKLHEAGKTLLDNIHLYEGIGNINGRITKNSRFVGLKLTLSNPDTIARINYIGLQLDTAQALNVYLFHSSQATAVKTFALTTTKSVSFQWLAITTEVLAYMNDNINAGGSYYIGYYEDDLTGQAIKKDISFVGNIPCGTCTEAGMNRGLFNKWSKFMSIQPFYVNSSDLSGTDGDLWNEEKEFLLDETTWGLNLQISVQCDLSRWICANTNVLIEPLSRQLVVDFLTEMTFSLRDNQKKERLAGLAAVALDNQENGMSGEARKLSSAIKALSFDFSNLSGPCAPCEKAGGKSRISSVWGR